MKLEFMNVSKINNRSKQTYHLKNANASFVDGKNTVILSALDSSKASLLSLISGIEQPTRGKIIKEGVFGTPIGESTYFHRELSGEENIRFICKIYGQNSNQVIKEMIEFANLGNDLKKKTKNYSPGIRKKIALSLSLLMKCDVYQLKSPLSHPHPRFDKNVQNKLKELAQQATIILATSDADLIKNYAESAVVIDSQGCLQYYTDVQSGIDAHNALKKGT